MCFKLSLDLSFRKFNTRSLVKISKLKSREICKILEASDQIDIVVKCLGESKEVVYNENVPSRFAMALTTLQVRDSLGLRTLHSR